MKANEVCDKEGHDWEETSRGRKGSIVTCRRCGKQRKIEIDDDYKEAVKRGDLVQPDDKDKFIELYGWHPDEDYDQVQEHLANKRIKPKHGKTKEQVKGYRGKKG